MFRSWADVIGPDIEVCAVQLPGREERRTEAPFTRLGPLLDALEQHLSPKLRGPYVYFGHSMGALVAFEFGRRQAARSMPGPAMLLLAGYRGPGAPASPAIHDLPESHLREALRRHGGTPAAVLADDAMMQVFSPLLRADFAVHEGWHYASGPRLDCPIVALAGDDDSFAPADAVEAFAAETHDRFRLHVFPGGHFFVSSARDAVLATIQAELRSAGLLAGLRRGELRELP